MRRFLVFVCFAVLKAQDAPDAASLLESSKHALDRYHSYQFQTTIIVAIAPTLDPAIPSRLISAAVAALSPGKVRIDSEIQAFGRTLDAMKAVSRGDSTVIYEEERGQFRVQNEEAVLSVLLDLAGVWSGSAPGDASSEVVLEDSIQVDGEKHDCWVIKKTASKVMLSTWALSPEISDATWTKWIDKVSAIDWRTTIRGRLRPEIQEEITSAKSGLKLNPSLPDSMFTFIPPAGSHQVDRLCPRNAGSCVH